MLNAVHHTLPPATVGRFSRTVKSLDLPLAGDSPREVVMEIGWLLIVTSSP
jgi:hypothetical protein